MKLGLQTRVLLLLYLLLCLRRLPCLYLRRLQCLRQLLYLHRLPVSTGGRSFTGPCLHQLPYLRQLPCLRRLPCLHQLQLLLLLLLQLLRK